MTNAGLGIGNHLRTVISEIGASNPQIAAYAHGVLGDPETPTFVRSHHPWLHPTKGWRNFARPRKTNRRRKLIRQGALSVKGSHEYNKITRHWVTLR